MKAVTEKPKAADDEGSLRIIVCPVSFANALDAGVARDLLRMELHNVAVLVALNVFGDRSESFKQTDRDRDAVVAVLADLVDVFVAGHAVDAWLRDSSVAQQTVHSLKSL